jgi:hypothetical protein
LLSFSFARNVSAQAPVFAGMIITVIRPGPQGPWLIIPDDGSEPQVWDAPPEVELHLQERMGADGRARFVADWIEEQGQRGIYLGERVPDA